MVNPLRRLSIDLRRTVTEGLAAGDPLEVILSRVTALLDAAGLEDALKLQLLGDATAQFEWIDSRTISAQQQQDLITILQTSGDAFATIGGGVNEAILEEVTRGIRENLPSKELEDIIARRVNNNRTHARTISTTALQALGRAERWAKAEETGVQRFRYVGPSPERAVCREWYKRVFTMDEINRLRNGTWEPVRLYCGGPNCRHQWVPEFD